jgi:16S rRNA (guanine1207-N2)-methyltransferase
MSPLRPSPDPYYRYSSHEIAVRGQTCTFFTRPALGQWQESLTSALLVAEWLELAPDARVLHVHCGTGLAGVAAARLAPAGQITLLDAHAVALECARRALAANEVANARVLQSDCTQAVQGQCFDAVLALLPKGRAAWEQTIWDAAHLLRTGGTLYLAGANKAGIKSAARYGQRVFGHVDVLGYKGGCRVVRAVKEEQAPPEPGAAPGDDYYTWRTVTTRVTNEAIAYATKPGLFSWKRLDEGTQLLVEAMQGRPLRKDDAVLDVGCGSGVLTLVAARQARAGCAVGVDVDGRAVEATRRTLALNEITNASALLGDCIEAVSDRRFGAIVTNPPFHQERATTYAIAEQIIRDAARLLGPSGRLYLVANQFLKYEPIIEQVFGQAQLLSQDRGFKVWYAEKGR